MGYIFLAVSLFAGAAKGFCGKKTSGFATGFRDAVLVNVIRMLFCIVVGFFFVLFDGGVRTLAPSGEMIGFAAMAGVSTAIFAVTWLLSVKVGAYMLVDISLMCGVLVPVFGSLAFLSEPLTYKTCIGLVLLLFAVVCMYLYNNKTKAKLTLPAALVLLLCGAASGLSDFSQKLYVATRAADAANTGASGSVAAFSFYTYIFATLTLVVIFLFVKGKRSCRCAEQSLDTPAIQTAGSPAEQTQKSLLPFRLDRVLPLIAVMALCMFAASFFQTLAAESLIAAVLYPLARGTALILSAVMSWVFFHEKPTLGSLLGIALALAAIIVMQL